MRSLVPWVLSVLLLVIFGILKPGSHSEVSILGDLLEKDILGLEIEDTKVSLEKESKDALSKWLRRLNKIKCSDQIAENRQRVERRVSKEMLTSFQINGSLFKIGPYIPALSEFYVQKNESLFLCKDTKRFNGIYLGTNKRNSKFLSLKEDIHSLL